MSGEYEFDRPGIYEITVKGALAADWSAWFEGLQIRTLTVLTGPVRDQAALHGLLARIRDLGLPLLSVQRINAPYTAKEESDGQE